MQPKDDLVKGACRGDARLVRSALRRGANPDAGYRGRTMLMWAIQEQHFDVIKVLVRARASMEKRDAEGFTAIDQAVGQGSLKIVAFLLKSGAKANSRSANGTPLHTACAWRRPRIARLLLQHGANPNAIDEDGRKPSDFVTSAKTASDRALIKMLTRVSPPLDAITSVTSLHVRVRI